MTNKKLLSLICASVLMLGAFTACSSKEDVAAETVITEEAAVLVDGTYKAEAADFDDNGWKAFVETTVLDGQITEAKFDYTNAEGALKSEDAEYNEKMKEISGTSPVEFGPALATALVEAQSPAAIDAVTGATSSSTTFVEMTTALMENMTAGNAEVLVVTLAH